MSFKGMDPEEGREIAEAMKSAGTTITELMDAVHGTVSGVDWVGPDADAFREEWTAFKDGAVVSLAQALSTSSYQELVTHADQQDTTSNDL